MEQEYNIGRLFLEVAARHPNKTAIKLAKSELSYHQVRNLVLSFALRMQELGVRQNSCVALDTAHVSVAAACYLGVALLGARWVQATKTALANPNLGIALLFHDGTNPYPVQPGIIPIDPSWSTHAAFGSGKPVMFEGYGNENDPWAYSQSSGTTGTPKVMALSYRNLVGRMRSEAFDRIGSDITCATPFSPLSPGGANTFCGIALRAGTVVVGGDYPFWQSSGVNLIVGTPVQHVKRLEGSQPPAGKKIPLARVGGAKASPDFLKMMFRYFDAVSIAYGSTEAGAICSRTLKAGDTDFDALGPPLDGSAVQIVDADDKPMPADSEGVVRVRSRYMVSSYVSDLAASMASFRDGWFYPGDIGRLSEEGSLRITGRSNDQLSLGGIKINALVIDRLLETVPGVSDGICFVEPGPYGVPVLSVVVALSEGAKSADVAETIRSYCRKTISSAVVPTSVYLADAAPRNSNGKATRHLAPALAAGWQKY